MGVGKHSEVPPETNSTTASASRRSFVEKLGLFNIGILTLGSIAIFIAIGFITFPWSGSQTARTSQPTPILWYDIVEWHNGATRLTTVGYVFIRLATGAQMGLLAVLVAAWTLETTGASAEHLPLLSIIRTVNKGPQSHIWNVFHSVRTGTKWTYSFMIVLAMLDAVALQFTSTPLGGDFGPARIVPQGYNKSIAYVIPLSDGNEAEESARHVDPAFGEHVHLAAPPVYPRFAGFSEYSNAHFDGDYADTGVSLRAFLPIADSDTSNILGDYAGPAMVVDFRVRYASFTHHQQ